MQSYYTPLPDLTNTKTRTFSSIADIMRSGEFWSIKILKKIGKIFAETSETVKFKCKIGQIRKVTVYLRVKRFFCLSIHQYSD